MAITERTYIIPLRKEWLKTVKYKRAKKAVRAIREFLMRHMKVDKMENIKIGKYLNLILWSHGIKNPPSRVKVNVVKDEKGIVSVEMVGAPKEEKKEEQKKTDKKQEAKPEEKKEATGEKKTAPVEDKTTVARHVAPRPAVPKNAPAQTPKKSSAQKQQAGQIIR
ncbi:MAG: 50S ribosomal protein L31e [Candidatus Woesearchaeota archaeon]